MITKIPCNEYLKRVDNMSAAEKENYFKRVGEWLNRKAPMLLPKANEPMARFQNVIQVSALWNDEECQAWDEGASLLTAMAASEGTWLPDMLYAKAAKRSIVRMFECFMAACADAGGAKEMSAEGTVAATQAVAPAVPVTDTTQTEAAPTPVRPKHIDQYVHLLPAKTQEKASTVKGLLRDLDVAREKMRLLADDPKASDASRATWAKTATKLDDKIRAIYKELDDEWEKLVKDGTVTVDDLGNAHVTEAKGPDAVAGKEKKAGRPVMTEQEKAAAAEKRAAEKAEREQQENAKKASLLRKFLIDRRNAKSEAQAEKWIAKFKEMVALGGEETVTDKVREAADYYDVDLVTLKPKDRAPEEEPEKKPEEETPAEEKPKAGKAKTEKTKK